MIRNPEGNKSNDVISTLYLKKYDADSNPATTIFDTAGCAGDSAAFFSMSSHKEYNVDDMENNGLADNCASSILVPWNVVVTLYPEPGYVGVPIVIDGSIENTTPYP